MSRSSAFVSCIPAVSIQRLVAVLSDTTIIRTARSWRVSSTSPSNCERTPLPGTCIAGVMRIFCPMSTSPRWARNSSWVRTCILMVEAVGNSSSPFSAMPCFPLRSLTQTPATPGNCLTILATRRFSPCHISSSLISRSSPGTITCPRLIHDISTKKAGWWTPGSGRPICPAKTGPSDLLNGQSRSQMLL